ncbi:MAG: PP2C family protein-serine/threonine phosphatase [Acidobacteriota bacterium]
MKTCFATHLGLVRENNEDRSLVKRFDDGSVLAAVADGMGGHAAGERAARIAIDVLDQFVPEPGDIGGSLVRAVREANRRVRQAASGNSLGMGTTLTAALVSAGRAYWAHVGDTRLQLFRDHRLRRVTDDHNVPGALFKEGKLDGEAARLHPMRHMLLRCIGCNSHEPDAGSFDLRPGDLLVISSDGLHDMVSAETVVNILGSDSTLESRLDELIRASLDDGGKDNVTVVAVEY